MPNTGANQQVQRVLAEIDRPEDAGAEKTLEVDTKPDRTRQFTHTSFSRMKMSWLGDEAIALGEVHYRADQAIQAQFGRALRLIAQLQEIAFIPAGHDASGEVLKRPDGSTRWQLDEHGDPVEDWSRLNGTQRSNFLHVITVHMHDWETVAIRMWSEAMYAKVLWEQSFARGFITLPGQAISGKPTIDDRTQTGHAVSGQDRYFAVFQAALSRQADALIRNLVRIQRLLENVSVT